MFKKYCESDNDSLFGFDTESILLMIKIIKQKLNSTNGVSILFALLVVLVCMAIGSVVLSAGSAAAGRVSRIAQIDQRYYSIMSAAKLFHEELGEQDPVTVIRTKKTVTTETEKFYLNSGSTEGEEDDEPDIDKDVEVTYYVTVLQGDNTAEAGAEEETGKTEDNKPVLKGLSRDDSVLVNASVNIVLGPDYEDKDGEEVWNTTSSSGTGDHPSFEGELKDTYTMTVTTDGASETLDALNVKVNSSLNAETGTLKDTFSPASAAGGSGSEYRVSEVFESSVIENQSSTSSTSSFDDKTDDSTEGDGYYTQTTVTTEIEEKVSVVNWKFSGIWNAY